MVTFIRKLYDWTLLWAKHPQSAKALCVLSFLESFVFPLPVDPLLLAMSFSRPGRSLYFAFLTTFFSVLGAFGGYFIGAYSWTLLSPWFFETVLSQQVFDQVVLELRQATFIAIFVAGFSPLPFKLFTIAAGVTKAPLASFFLAALLSRGLRYFILAGVIFIMGERAQIWIESHFEKITYGVCALLIITLVLFKCFY